MPNCAKKDDCPRAVLVGCDKCKHYITPEHYQMIKKADRNFIRGFFVGVIFSIIVSIIVTKLG